MREGSKSGSSPRRGKGRFYKSKFKYQNKILINIEYEKRNIEKSYQLAKEQYASFGIDTDKVIVRNGQNQYQSALLANG